MLFVVVHFHDEAFEVLGLLEVAEVAHGVVKRLTAALDELREFERLRMHEVHVVHVKVLHHILDVVKDVVKRLRHLDDVLAVDGSDEVGGYRLENLMVDAVALVLKLMRPLQVLLQRGCFRELLDCFNKQRCLGNS